MQSIFAHKSRSISWYVFSIILLSCLCLGCGETKNSEVVIYTSLDRRFSEPVLNKFEKNTGIQVRVKYDTESTKTVGLTACLMEEKNHPRCDVFWNNEIVNTIRLKKSGILAVYRPIHATDIPPQFQDAEGYWTGFAARARVLIVNTERVKPEEIPSRITDLLLPRWRGKAGIARPIAGTAATHAACLFSLWGDEKAKDFFSKLKANQISLESGNKSCAEKVGSGELDIALTDTDDAMIEVAQGRPVRIVYLDAKEDEIGTLFIPNTLALIQGCPNPENGKKLIDFLLSPEVEEILASGESAQIPLNKKTKIASKVKTPWEIPGMKVSFEKAASDWDKVREYMLSY